MTDAEIRSQLCSYMYKMLTRLYQSYVENFIDLAVVRCYVENAFRCVLDTGDVHWDQIFRNLLPFHAARATGADVEYFRP